MPNETDPIVQNTSALFTQAGSFKNQWLNFVLYLPNLIYIRKNSERKSRWCRWLVPGFERLRRNDESIGGKETDTSFLANGNEYRTAFIEIDKTDLLTMLRTFPHKHGYSTNVLPALLGVYKNDDNSVAQGATLDQPGRRYFYRGLGSSDVLKMLVDWNVLS